MPKRTTEFQRLVFLVKKQMAEGATVTESKMLRDSADGAEVEVDVCIELTAAGHPLCVGIECCDSGRRATKEWVNEMSGKHSRLPTDKLILASRAGFTKNAMKVARHLNLPTLDMKIARDGDVAKVVGRAAELFAKTIQYSAGEVLADVGATDDMHAERVRTNPDTSVFTEDGNLVGMISEYVTSVLTGAQVRDDFLRTANDEHKSFTVELGVPRVSGQRVCIEKMEPKVLRPVEMLTINGAFTCGMTKFPMKYGDLGDVKVAWGTGTIGGRDAMIVASAFDSQTLMTVHIDGEPSKPSSRSP